MVEHNEFDEEVNDVVDEDEAKAVAMKFVKELGEGLKLEDVVRSYSRVFRKNTFSTLLSAWPGKG